MISQVCKFVTSALIVSAAVQTSALATPQIDSAPKLQPSQFEVPESSLEPLVRAIDHCSQAMMSKAKSTGVHFALDAEKGEDLVKEPPSIVKRFAETQPAADVAKPLFFVRIESKDPEVWFVTYSNNHSCEVVGLETINGLKIAKDLKNIFQNHRSWRVFTSTEEIKDDTIWRAVLINMIKEASEPNSYLAITIETAKFLSSKGERIQISISVNTAILSRS
jgi:hypothetical protein